MHVRVTLWTRRCVVFLAPCSPTARCVGGCKQTLSSRLSAPLAPQTGSGKTYTMSGPGNSFSERGIVPRAITHVFQVFEKSRTEAGADKYVIRVSYLEIYQNRLFDLLAGTPEMLGGGADGGEEDDAPAGGSLKKDIGASERALPGEGRPAIRGVHGLSGLLQVGGLRGRRCLRCTLGFPGFRQLFPPTPTSIFQHQVLEDTRGRVHVRGLTTPIVRSEAEALNWLFAGEANRALGEHTLNKASTRSHCIFTIHIEQARGGQAEEGGARPWSHRQPPSPPLARRACRRRRQMR